jgi:hypothetical protein
MQRLMLVHVVGDDTGETIRAVGAVQLTNRS